MGAKHAILLANHGLLTAASSIEEATMLAVWMEHAAEMHCVPAPSDPSSRSRLSLRQNRATSCASRRSSV
jgi:hypothetical protein